MWLFTETGFVSAVRPSAGSDLLRVRARDAKSLEPMVDMFDVAISKSPHRDYPYRVELTTAQLIEFVAASTATMEYTNFKSQVYRTRGTDFAHALHDVWEAMHQVEDAEARTEI